MLRSCLLLLVACGPGSGEVVDPPGALTTTPDQAPDGDGDGVGDDVDNCVDAANPDQEDVDANGVGDACDVAPDLDVDGVPDYLDNCPGAENTDQTDADDDGVGDACDNCPEASNYDQADADADGIGDICPCDACSDEEWCVQRPDEPVACETDCPMERQGSDNLCCAFGSRWSPVGEACLLPDLHVDAEAVETSLVVAQEDYGADACEIVEGCILAEGTRQVLRFDLAIVNDGDGDLHLGATGYPPFVPSECHAYDHLDGLVTYELLASDGSAAVPARRQGACVADGEAWQKQVGPAKYTCGLQGLTRGWAATYDADSACQLVDITGVAPGTYTLRIEVDQDGLLADSDATNNVTEVDVVVP